MIYSVMRMECSECWRDDEGRRKSGKEERVEKVVCMLHKNDKATQVYRTVPYRIVCSEHYLLYIYLNGQYAHTVPHLTNAVLYFNSIQRLLVLLSLHQGSSL